MTKKLHHESIRKWVKGMHEKRPSIINSLCDESNAFIKDNGLKDRNGNLYHISPSWFRRLVSPKSSVNYLHNPGSINIDILAVIRAKVNKGEIKL